MPYRNMVSLRLDDRDLDALEAASERSGLSRSELLRSLLRVPPGADRQRTVYAVDGRTLGRMATELVRWGRHYNQAVHALNTIALLVRRGARPSRRSSRRCSGGPSRRSRRSRRAGASSRRRSPRSRTPSP